MGPTAGSGAALDERGMFPKAWAGVRVLFDGVPAPILYASATQVNAVVPFTMYRREQIKLEVEYQGVRSDAMGLGMAESAPRVFSTFEGGTSTQIILNQDGCAQFPKQSGRPRVYCGFLRHRLGTHRSPRSRWPAGRNSAAQTEIARYGD